MPETDGSATLRAPDALTDRGRIAVAACWAMGGAYLATLPFRSAGGPAWLAALTAAAFLPHGWVAGCLAWRAADRPDLDALGRRGWRALAVGFAILAANNLVFYASRRGLVPEGIAGVAERLLPLAWSGLALAGLSSLVRATRTPLDRTRFWLDTMTVFCAGCIILLFVFSRMPGSSSTATIRSSLLTVVFPALDGAILFVAGAVLLRPAPGVARAAIWALAAAVAIGVVADLAYGRLAIASGHRPGAWYSAAYMISALLSVTAAQLQHEHRAPSGERGAGAWTPSSVIPHAMVVGALAILLAELRRNWSATLGWLVIGAVALAILVVARQLVVRLETEHLAARQRAQDMRFRALVEHATDMISVVDRDGIVRYQAGDTASALGRAPSALEGTSLVDLAHPDDAGRVRAAIVGAAVPNPVLRWRARHVSGAWRELETTVTDLLAEPAVQGIVLNTRDITAQVILEAQLNQAQKLEAVGLLAGGIAHDFNNILAAIRASAELAAGGGTGDTAQQADIREITSAVDRGAALTRQLLAFGRRDVVREQLLDVRDVVRALEPMLRRLIPSRVVLEVDLAALAVPVRGDASQVEQVVLNLCLNARDAIAGTGSIRLSVGSRTENGGAGTTPGRYAVISVTDTGEGILPATMERLFEPFFTTKPGGQGSGLGLSTVYGIAKRSGGSVTVRSTPGAGSTFEVLLPLASSDVGSGRDAGTAPARLASATILVVDDEPAIRESVIRYLRAQGCTVVGAATGADALEALATAVPALDVLVTDLAMPGMSGWELVAHATARQPSLQVVIMSGYAGGGLRPTMLPSAVSAQLTKPFDLADLGRAVRDALARGRVADG